VAGKIDVKTLGHSGVLIDQNTLEPTVPGDALRLAQNATHDPRLGFGGGLRKRPGLARFSAAAGGAILGGIPMAVAGTGGAPAVTATNTPTGDPTGAPADGAGAPGSTTDGGAATYPAPGASAFGGGTLFSGARLLILGLQNNQNANHYGEGWFVTSKDMQNSANIVTTPGPPCTTGMLASTTFMGSPSCLSPDGYVYYIVSHSEASRETAPIRKTNGATDVAVATIPVNPHYPGSGTWVVSVTWMHYGSNGNIYIAVIDKMSAGNVGRLMKLNPTTGVLTELNTGAPGATIGQYSDVPSCCAYHEGKVFWGTYPNTNDTSASINVVSSDETYASQDYHPANDERFAGIACMIETSAGVLVAGSQDKSAASASRPVLLWRQPGAGIAAANNWISQDINDGDSSVSGAFYTSLVEFNGFVYVSYYVPGSRTKIYKLTVGVDGATGNTIATAFTTVFTNATAVPLFLFVDDGVLYAWGATGLGGTRMALFSTDGATFTSEAGNLPTTNQAIPIPIGFGVAQ
jgi:hypothetical protein